MKQILCVVTVLVMVLWFAQAVSAQAGPGDSPLPTPTSTPEPGGDEQPAVPTPTEFLGWLAISGATLVGILTALLERKSAWFQGLSGDGKGWVSFGLGAGIPALAGLLLLYVPENFWQAITPVWTILGAALLGYLGKELAYLTLVRPNK